MKVIHVYKDYYPPVYGGIETHINLLIKYLKKKVPSIECEVLISNPRSIHTKIETIDEVKVTKVGELVRIFSAPINPALPMWFKKKKADIYHFHYPNPTAELSYLLANPNGKLIVTYHSDIVRQAKLLPLLYPFQILFFKKAKVIIATSPNYIETSPILSKFKEKCVVIPLGIEIERFKFTEEIAKSVRRIKEKYPNPIILFVGKLRYYKGVHILIRAMRYIPQATLLIIGTGPKEKEWKELASALQLNDRVIFLGELSDSQLVSYLHACELLCLPSTERSEAFGVVQLEAHACSKPVVSTGLNTGVPFVNLNNQTGFVVPPNSELELANAILKLLENKELANQFGKFAKERVEKEFSANRMAERVLEIYEKLLQS